VEAVHRYACVLLVNRRTLMRAFSAARPPGAIPQTRQAIKAKTIFILFLCTAVLP